MFKRIITRIRKWKYERVLSKASIEDRFSGIYKNKIWFSNKESLSGAGSTITATENLRNQLPMLLQNINANTLLDVGCGDFNWMKEVKLPCKYIGVDIVESVIQRNNELYKNVKVEFLKLNAISDPLPPNCDIVLCREVLFHLSFEDGLKLVNNIRQSGVKYLLSTMDSRKTENIDIRTGEFRDINLLLPPYNLPAYINKIDDDGVAKGRILGLWKL